jgi:uncharacterized membrane protein
MNKKQIIIMIMIIFVVCLVGYSYPTGKKEVIEGGG